MRDAGLPAKKVDVARLLRIQPPSINDWDKPGGFPTIARTVAIAKHAKVCVEWLLTERGPKFAVPDDPTAQRLWSIWPRIDDVTKGELIGKAQERLRPPNDDQAGGTQHAR